MKRILLSVGVFLAVTTFAQTVDQVGASPGPGMHYATDAYPGFDLDKPSTSPERKEPRWLAFLNGPKCDSATDELAYCRELELAGEWSRAAKHYDALVREWPASAEAPIAQERLAEILLDKEDDPEEAFAEYRYLADFYTSRCDYNAVLKKMYDIACLLRLQGKTILFFRFKNSTDVRRAFESAILRAPGARWVPAAMLIVGELREEEGYDEEAVKVYENLRNLHHGKPEAEAGVLREASARMRLLEKHGYNRPRCLDTIGFLRLARTLVTGDGVEAIDEMLDKATAFLEDEAYRAALFYDSRMRTPESAISAYEGFLSEFPTSRRAESVRVRVNELKTQIGVKP